MVFVKIQDCSRIIFYIVLDGTAVVKSNFYILNHNIVFRCVELLIAYDANINHAADGGQTPLYLACKNGNKECIKLLLEAGSDRSIKTTVSTNQYLGILF